MIRLDRIAPRPKRPDLLVADEATRFLIAQGWRRCLESSWAKAWNLAFPSACRQKWYDYEMAGGGAIVVNSGTAGWQAGKVSWFKSPVPGLPLGYLCYRIYTRSIFERALAKEMGEPPLSLRTVTAHVLLDPDLLLVDWTLIEMAGKAEEFYSSHSVGRFIKPVDPAAGLW